MITTIRTSNPKGPSAHSLSAIIGSFKSAASKRIQKMGLNKEKSIWQRNYFDHIIRNEEDYFRIIEYIQTNPLNWEEDEEFISSKPYQLPTI